jgi:ribulose-phosphate 3-epimerase
MATLSASILSADLARLADQVDLVRDRVDAIHVDVIDARFASPVTIGALVVSALRPLTSLPIHAHLMVDAPEGRFDELAQAGLDLVSVHLEAVEDPAPVLAKARGLGLRAGLALAPSAGVEALAPHLDDVDDVLVTPVPPGRRGASFLEAALPTIAAIRAELDRRGRPVDLGIEGVADPAAMRRCVDAGASVVVAGSSIFGAADAAAAAAGLRAALEAA